MTAGQSHVWIKSGKSQSKCCPLYPRKRPNSRRVGRSELCQRQKSLVAHGLLINGVWAGGSLRLSTLKQQPQMLFSEVSDRASQKECPYKRSLHPCCRE